MASDVLVSIRMQLLCTTFEAINQIELVRDLTKTRFSNKRSCERKTKMTSVTSPPKRFMRLVQDFIEKEDLATFGGVELEDGAPMANVNIDEIIFAQIAGVPADFPKLEKDVKSIAEGMAEIRCWAVPGSLKK